LRLGVSGSPNGLSGSQAYHYRVYGLDREALAATAVQQLART
jgi:hypothetical protein